MLAWLLCDFKGIWASFAQKPYIFVIFQQIQSFGALAFSFFISINTQVNRMSRSRRVLAIGGKQRILRLDMVCIETILFHLDSL